MANPALKNGYISIATELVEKIATISIPSSEMRIIWVVWRKTWGWKDGLRHKDWDWISFTQFERLTTMKHGNVGKSLKSLVVKRILLKSEKGYKFNQNYEEWGVVKRIPPVVKRILPSMQTHTETGSQTHTNNRKKETNTIETIPFEDFWSKYPSKKKKKESERVWNSLPYEIQLTVIADIPRREKSNDWKKEGGKYIPHPTSYLRGERWSDTIEDQIIIPNSITIG